MHDPVKKSKVVKEKRKNEKRVGFKILTNNQDPQNIILPVESIWNFKEVIMGVWNVSCKSKEQFQLFKRSGLRLRFDKAVDADVKCACKEFCIWLRKNYAFPIRIPVYIKHKEFIKACDGECVSATFFGPYNYNEEPYIRVAVGDYPVDVQIYGKDNALAFILHSIAHELTHYFQWINKIQLPEDKEETQACKLATIIVHKYERSKKHT